jgi:2,5-diamino-6-(ribosylamino)-4(3H)-pyrimidinone 5'-phosphate reductase
MHPRVIVHNGVSVDGHIDWHQGDTGPFYQVAGVWQADVLLAGSDTLLLAYDGQTVPDEDAAAPAATPEPGRSSLRLVVPDGRGRIPNWRQIRGEPWWGEVLVLISRTTPSGYVVRLESLGVEHVIMGDDHVDVRPDTARHLSRARPDLGRGGHSPKAAGR